MSSSLSRSSYSRVGPRSSGASSSPKPRSLEGSVSGGVRAGSSSVSSGNLGIGEPPRRVEAISKLRVIAGLDAMFKDSRFEELRILVANPSARLPNPVMMRLNEGHGPRMGKQINRSAAG